MNLQTPTTKMFHEYRRVLFTICSIAERYISGVIGVFTVAGDGKIGVLLPIDVLTSGVWIPACAEHEVFPFVLNVQYS